MSFDPDAYLASKAGPAFDPDAYLKQKELAGGPVGAALEHGANAAMFGFGDEAVGGYKALVKKLLGDERPAGDIYREGRDAVRQRLAAESAEHPVASGIGDVAGSLVPAMAIPGGAFATLPRAVATGAAMGAVQGAGGSTAPTARGVAVDAAMGGAAGGVAGGAGYGLQKGIGAAAGAVADKLRGTEGKLATQLGDKAAAAAEKTASSAVGGLGKATAQGSSDMKLLEMLRAQGVSPEMEQKIVETLSSPDAAALRESLAGNAVERLPDQLGRIDNARALAAATAADVPVQRAAGQTPEYAAGMLKQRAAEQAKRYAIPIAGGVAGAVLGPDDHRGAGALAGLGLGMAAGRGISPGVNAVVKNLAFSPEARRLASGVVASGFEKLAAITRTNPQALGRFAPILTNAMREGEQSFAARTYALAQTDPDFQSLQQKLAEAK